VITDPSASPSRVAALSYGPEGVSRQEVTTADIPSLRSREARPVVWVDVQGLGDGEALQAVASHFGIHSLALEDVVHTRQRPKLEEYEDQLFIVMRMTRPNEFRTEQLAVFLGDDYVVTFQEEPGDWFDPIRDRLRRDGSRIRQRGPDYLAYALADAATDSYFPLLEQFEDRLDAFEEKVMEQGGRLQIPDLYALRRDLHGVHRQLWPLKELLGRLSRSDVDLITDDTRLFLRDCLDHAAQLLDTVENQQDQVSGLIDVTLGMAGQHMNEIMKVLTIMASLFIPLTFIAGIYGMNFDAAASPWNMPELAARWGYPIVLAVMAGVALGMLAYFRRLGWIGSGQRKIATRPKLENTTQPDGGHSSKGTR